MPGARWSWWTTRRHTERLLFGLGTGFEYSDTGFVIAAILAERMMGRPLHEIYR